MKPMWFVCAIIFTLATLSIAMGSVPSGSRVTDDTAIYQKLSEINVGKTRPLNFDAEIERLSALETRYKEHLPTLARLPSLQGPMKRMSAQKYRYAQTAKKK